MHNEVRKKSESIFEAQGKDSDFPYRDNPKSLLTLHRTSSTPNSVYLLLRAVRPSFLPILETPHFITHRELIFLNL